MQPTVNGQIKGSSPFLPEFKWIYMKYKLTRCASVPKELYGSMWGFQPVDMRKKYFVCIHCKEEHLVKDYVMVSNDT